MEGFLNRRLVNMHVSRVRHVRLQNFFGAIRLSEISAAALSCEAAGQAGELSARAYKMQMPAQIGKEMQHTEMLHNKTPLRDSGSEMMTPEWLSPVDALESFIRILRRRFRIVLYTALTLVALAAMYAFVTPTSYTARALMAIESKRVQLFQPQQPTSADAQNESAMVDSQVEILKSENVLIPVVRGLRLTENSEFARGGLFGRLLELISALVSPNEALQPQSSMAPFERPASQLERRTLRAVENRLSVSRIGLTRVIEISFRSQDPELAAKVANAIVDSYISDQLKARFAEAHRASAWLEVRIAELGEKAAATERAVVEFKAKNNIVERDDQQLGQLNTELIAARAQVSEARAKVERIEAIINNDSENAPVSATVTDSMKSDVVGKLRSRYYELANREAEWAAKYGSQHSAVVNLRNQMREIQRSVRQELTRLSETYKSDLEIAKRKELGIQKQLSQTALHSQATSQAQVTLRGLESSARSYRALYDNFLQQKIESLQQQSLPSTDARSITAASRPLTSSHPKSLFALALASIGGTVLGVGIAVWRDMTDRVFRTKGEIESYLRTKCIALLPRLEIESAMPSLSGGLDETKVHQRSIAKGHGAAWAAVDAPLSRFAEGIWSIKLAAANANIPRESCKVIGIISVSPDEGKSTISANLAQLLAQSGARTILIDCDLRVAGLTNTLAPNATVGISEVVGGASRFVEAVWKDEQTNLLFLPAIVRPDIKHPSEVFASAAMKEMFKALRKNSDWIVVDLPPLAPIIDVYATTGLVDAYLLVVAWGQTNLRAAAHIINSAEDIHDRLIGAVINKVDISKLQDYDSDYGYYGEKYYRDGPQSASGIVQAND